MKRSSSTILPAPHAKAPNTEGPPPGQGEEWTCRQCQNVNWPLRTTCNKCKAPGPWTCPACGNKNFQGREVCNKKNCGQPRPGAAGAVQSMMMQSMIMPQHMMNSMGMQAAGNPVGSWTCKNCQNVNWPLRSTCKKCDIPREQGDPAYRGYLKVCAATGENPSGSWVCTACENVNWPQRTTCKKCEAPKDEVDGGPPKPTSPGIREMFPTPSAFVVPGSKGGGKGGGKGQQALPSHPHGSWSCTACRNVNWPLRTTCKKCGISKEQGDGSWTCPSCENVNWPLRTTCKKCSAPKPEYENE